MRKQERQPEPEIPPERKTKWTERWMKNTGEFNWPQYNNQKLNDIYRPVLKDQTDAHCSYCDAYPVKGVSRETIDHFKPKSRKEFRQFAFDWENLFYCCGWCQTEKWDRYCSLLLKPDAPDYSFERYFYPDFTTGEILPHPYLSDEDRAKSLKTIEILNLNSDAHTENRRIELLKWQDAEQVSIEHFAYRFFLPQRRRDH